MCLIINIHTVQHTIVLKITDSRRRRRKRSTMPTAADIDEEIVQYRKVQEEIQRVRTDLQLVLSQLTENQMVHQELQVLDSSTKVYKMVGPVLLKNSVTDAQDTVTKRLDFIRGEQTRLETKNQNLEARGAAIAATVQQMQSQLQQATVAAVQQIKDQATAAS